MPTSVHKQFNPELYAENDGAAKAVVREYLDRHGFMTCCHEDYGADIKSFRPQLHEVEVKRAWQGVWPHQWRTVHIPARKARLLNGTEVIFWIISGDFRQAIVIRSRDLKPEYLQEVKNSEIAEGEQFYCVPINKCKFVGLKGG